MRLLAILVFFALSIGSLGARAQTSDADTHAIQDTIRGQLEAFKADDGTTAYSFAAPNVRMIFPTVDGFMTMVKNGYKPVYRPKSYTFGQLADKDGSLAQSVEIVGPDGDYWTAVYTVAKQPDGSWKITGCFIVKSEGGSA